MTRELTAVEELRHPRNVGDLADDGLCLPFALFPFRPLGAALNPKSFQTLRVRVPNNHILS